MTASSRTALIAVGAALLLAVLGAILWIQDRREKARIEASERIAERMLEEELARPGNRLTLGEAAESGDARAIYDEVMPLLGALTEDEENLLFLVEWRGAESPWRLDEEEAERIDAVMARTRPLLDRLRPVLTAPTLSRRIAPDRWPPPDSDDWEAFSLVVSEHVQRHVVSGETSEALDLCVLRWFAALDYGRHNSLLAFLPGQSLADTSTSDIRRILADCDVSPPRLDRLAREVDTLHASAPDLLDAWRIEEIHLRWLFADQARAITEFGDMSGPVITEAMEALTTTRESLHAVVEGRPGRAAVAAAEARFEEIREDANPLVGMTFLPFSYTVGSEADVRTLVEMLRVTVALARYRARHGREAETLDALVPELLEEIPDCSWSGEPLHYEEGRLWSVGGDGGSEPLGYDQGVRENGQVVFTLHTTRLQAFPWSEDVDAATRERVETALGDLLAGGTPGEAAGDTLVAMGREVCGRLIGEFAAISRDPGFGVPEGRAKAGAIDDVLRRIDGFMERRWREHAVIGVDSDPDFVRRIALRWTNWWYREGWRTDPQWPWDREDE